METGETLLSGIRYNGEMRYSLRTLLILTILGPPALSGALKWYANYHVRLAQSCIVPASEGPSPGINNY